VGGASDPAQLTSRYSQLAKLLNCTVDDAINSTVFQNINKLAAQEDVEQCATSAIDSRSFSPIKHVLKGTHYNVVIIDFKAFYPNIVLEN
jgi:MinD-like ATPase involved in chromosome partitioning or flagellar assembly